MILFADQWSLSALIKLFLYFLVRIERLAPPWARQRNSDLMISDVDSINLHQDNGLVGDLPAHQEHHHNDRLT